MDDLRQYMDPALKLVAAVCVWLARAAYKKYRIVENQVHGIREDVALLHAKLSSTRRAHNRLHAKVYHEAEPPPLSDYEPRIRPSDRDVN